MNDIETVPDTEQIEYIRTPAYYRSERDLIPLVTSKLNETDTPFSTLVISVLKEAKSHVVGLSAPPPRWFIGLTRDFMKQVDSIDRKFQGRVLQALGEITDAPTAVRGDTVKPLTKEDRFKGCWRYRLGDFRIIYYPNSSDRKITLIAFDARADAY
jgi:mRNA-degrading endonuclease RelE of RelBE toxin-antitoxin system